MEKTFKTFIVLDLIDKITRPLSSVKKSIKTFNDAIEPLTKIGVKMTTLGIASGAVVFGLAKTASQMQDLQSQFTVFLGDGQKAVEMLADLKKYAGQTKFEIPEVATAGKQLLGFGFTAGDVMPTIKKLADVATGLGIPIGDLTYLFGTLKSAGKATTMDLNQFAMRGIPVWKELEKATGLAGQSLRKYVEQGNVDFKTIDKIFTGMTSKGGQYFGMVDKLSKNFSVGLSNVGDAVKGLATALGSPMLSPLTKLLSGFSSFLNGITAFLEKHKILNKLLSYTILILTGLAIPLGIAVVLYANWHKITRSLTVSKLVFSKSIKLLTADIWKNITATKVWQMVSGGFKTGGLLGGIKGLSGAFGGLTLSIIKSSIAFLTSPIGLIIAAVVLLGLYIYRMVKHWDSYSKFFKNIFAGVIQQFDRLKKNLKPLFDMLKPIKDFFANLFKNIDMGWLDAILFGLGFILGVIEVIFGTVLNTIGEIVLGGINDVIEGVKMIFEGDVLAGFAKIFTGLFKIMAWPLLSLIKGIINLWNSLNKKFEWNLEIPQLPEFANGVSNFGGGLAVVGEDGPELVNLGRGSSVYSNDKSKSLINSFNKGQSAGQTIINNHYYIDKVEITPDKITDISKIVNLFNIIEKEASYAS
ncbi:MAG: tape measure protein [Spirochaetes bacterium]|nr:tape measure protein [Spirochaetota bacterium]